jgi:hypothetical protein
MSRGLVGGYQRFEVDFNTEAGGEKFLRNVSYHLQDYTVSPSRGP